MEMKIRRASLMRLGLFLAVLVLLGGSPGGAEKPLPAVASLSIEFTDIAAGIGFSWGRGLLRFEGRNYPFKVQGLSVGDVGIARVSAVGKVYNLKRLSDFTGTYAAVGAGVSLAGGVAGLTMQNQRGVIVDLSAVQQGVKLNLGPQGLTIDWQ